MLIDSIKKWKKLQVGDIVKVTHPADRTLENDDSVMGFVKVKKADRSYKLITVMIIAINGYPRRGGGPAASSTREHLYTVLLTLGGSKWEPDWLVERLG